MSNPSNNEEEYLYATSTIKNPINTDTQYLKLLDMALSVFNVYFFINKNDLSILYAFFLLIIQINSMTREQENISDTTSSIGEVDDVYNEIMYHVLGQFLVTKDNKNIATVLDELTTELKIFRKTFTKEITSVSEILKSMTIMENEHTIESTPPVSSEPHPTPIFSSEQESFQPLLPVSSLEQESSQSLPPVSSAEDS